MTSRPGAGNPPPTLLYVSTDPEIAVFGRKGASTHVREMARALARAGVKVVIATTADAEPDAPADPPFRVVRLGALRGRPARWIGFDLRRWWTARRAAAAVQRLFDSLRPAAVYERWSFFGGAGALRAARAGVPAAIEENALIAREMAGRLHFPRWVAAHERRTLRAAPAITAISAVMKQQLIQEAGCHPGRILISPMGIDPARFHPGVSPEPARRRLAELGVETGPGAGALIGYIGSLNYYHRPNWLLDLIAGLKARGIEARVALLGGDPHKIERLRARARERQIEGQFHFLGPRPHEELPAWFAAFDLTVIPGASPQSSPTKLVEALAIGAPTLAPDQPNIRDLAGELGEDFFFAPERPEAFIEAAANALRNLEALRERARRFAPQFARRHSWDARAADLLGLLGLRAAPRRESPFSPTVSE